MRSLDVYFHDQCVGDLQQADTGQLFFQYREAYLEEPSAAAVSLSLPLQLEAFGNVQAKPFFSGLLPDEMVRQRLARYLGVSEKNPFSLLEVIGGECAGALALYPSGEQPPEPSERDIVTMDDGQLKELLALLKRRPLMAGDDNVRLSLAGAQDKIAVGFKDNAVQLVCGASPTTHILKPIIDHVEDSAHNEVFCLRLAQKVKIEAPDALIGWVDGTPYFLIERYDRKNVNGEVKRLHQEDFCQALGIAPEMKYEREGGPSVLACLELVQRFSSKPARDRLALLRRVLFNYIIGNADAHGKNFSLLYRQAKPDLSPAYDLLCTEIYPDLTQKMAMKIGGRYKPDDVLKRHWERLVPDTAVAKKALKKEVLLIAARSLKSAKELRLEMLAEGVDSLIFDRMLEVIKHRVARLQQAFS